MFFNKKKNNKTKVYCKSCKRADSYLNSNLDLCEIPDCGLPFYNRFEYTVLNNDFNFDKAKGSFTDYTKIIDKEGQKFIKKRLSKIKTNSINKGTINGYPSELNYDNDCYFYQQK